MNMKKAISLFLSTAMLLGLCVVSASADDPDVHGVRVSSFTVYGRLESVGGLGDEANPIKGMAPVKITADPAPVDANGTPVNVEYNVMNTARPDVIIPILPGESYNTPSTGGNYRLFCAIGGAATGSTQQISYAYISLLPTSLQYTVSYGDTMESIALNFYGSTAYAQALRDYNWKAFTLTGGVLRIDGSMVLNIPATLGTGVRRALPTADIGEVVYKVLPGDTLMSIAIRAYAESEAWRVIWYCNSNRVAHDADAQLYPGLYILLPTMVADRVMIPSFGYTAGEDMNWNNSTQGFMVPSSTWTPSRDLTWQEYNAAWLAAAP